MHSTTNLAEGFIACPAEHLPATPPANAYTNVTAVGSWLEAFTVELE